MRNNRTGLAPAAIIILVALGVIIVAGGAWYWHSEMASVPAAQPSNSSSTTSVTPSSTASAPTSTSVTAWISRASGPVGAKVTIHGSGFAKTGNVVTMNGLTNGDMKNLTSTDGQTITFTVPISLGPVCHGEICAQFIMEVMNNSSYVVAVESADGKTSQPIGSFTVTSGGKLPM